METAGLVNSECKDKKTISNRTEVEAQDVRQCLLAIERSLNEAPSSVGSVLARGLLAADVGLITKGHILLETIFPEVYSKEEIHTVLRTSYDRIMHWLETVPEKDFPYLATDNDDKGSVFVERMEKNIRDAVYLEIFPVLAEVYPFSESFEAEAALQVWDLVKVLVQHRYVCWSRQRCRWDKSET